MIRRTWIVSLVIFVVTALGASNKPAANKAVTVVDEGTYSIFQNGQQIATESFTIRQYPDSSVTSSELHGEVNASGGKLEQTSELTLLPDGSLSRYEWKQIAPTRSSATIEPSNEFLSMRIVTDGKTTDQPFFLTPDAFILDDYFFSTREVLLWRYLASSCKARAGGDGCDLVKARFPIVIPRRRTSSQVFIEFKGYEDTPLNGRPQKLRHFVMLTDGPDWHMWLDSNLKLLRISIPDANTEILRK